MRSASRAVPFTQSASWPSGRDSAPVASKSSVRPSHSCCRPANASSPSCQVDSGWSPSSGASRSRISSQPRSGSIARTSGRYSRQRSASAWVIRPSCLNRSLLHFKKAVPVRESADSTTEMPHRRWIRGTSGSRYPAAIICSRIHRAASASHPGRDHCGRRSDQPALRSPIQDRSEAQPTADRWSQRHTRLVAPSRTRRAPKSAGRFPRSGRSRRSQSPTLRHWRAAASPAPRPADSHPGSPRNGQAQH